MAKQAINHPNFPGEFVEEANTREAMAYEIPVKIEGLVADISHDAGPNQFRFTVNLVPLEMSFVHDMLIRAGFKKNTYEMDTLMEEIGQLVQKRQLVKILSERMEIL